MVMSASPAVSDSGDSTALTSSAMACVASCAAGELESYMSAYAESLLRRKLFRTTIASQSNSRASMAVGDMKSTGAHCVLLSAKAHSPHCIASRFGRSCSERRTILGTAERQRNSNEMQWIDKERQ